MEQSNLGSTKSILTTEQLMQGGEMMETGKSKDDRSQLQMK